MERFPELHINNNISVSLEGNFLIAEAWHTRQQKATKCNYKHSAVALLQGKAETLIALDEMQQELTPTNSAIAVIDEWKLRISGQL